MNIIHIVSTYPPYYGGMGNVVFQTACELAKRGHRVQVFTPLYGHEETEQPVSGMKEYATRLTPAIKFGNAAYLPDIHKRLEDADIVHLHYPFFGTANLVRKWKLKHPDRQLVITYHMDNRAKGWKGLFFSYYAKYWLPKILGIADCLIASSFDFIAESDASALYRSNPEKWVELPFGVDTKRFAPREKPTDLFVAYELNPDIPTIVFVGGMDQSHYFKGVPVLLEALLSMKQMDLDIQAVFVGDGSLRPEFELRAQTFGIMDRVRFVGRISDDALPYHYNMGDLFVLPSTTRGEAFGMVLLEAMASGLPVIASDLAGVRTVAEKGGMVVESGNVEEFTKRLMELISDSEKRRTFGLNARDMAQERFTKERLIKDTERLYNNTLQKNKDF